MSNLFPAHLPSSRSAVIERQVWGELFGDLMRRVRKKAGRSLEDVAPLAGMSVAEWTAVEAGRVPNTLEQLHSMADALGVGWNGMASIVFLCAGAWGR